MKSSTVKQMLLLPVLLLSACGNEGTTHSAAKAEVTTTTTSPSDVLVAAGRAYSATYNAGKGKEAYAMWSARCKKTKTEEQFQSDSNNAVLFFGTARLQSMTATVDGDKGKLSASWDMPVLDKTDQPWIMEDNAWKWDGCP